MHLSNQDCYKLGFVNLSKLKPQLSIKTCHVFTEYFANISAQHVKDNLEVIQFPHYEPSNMNWLKKIWKM